jgi:hypothetical protein
LDADDAAVGGVLPGLVVVVKDLRRRRVLGALAAAHFGVCVWERRRAGDVLLLLLQCAPSAAARVACWCVLRCLLLPLLGLLGGDEVDYYVITIKWQSDAVREKILAMHTLWCLLQKKLCCRHICTRSMSF